MPVHDSDGKGNNYNHTNHAGIKCKLNLPYSPVCWCGCMCSHLVRIQILKDKKHTCY